MQNLLTKGDLKRKNEPMNKPRATGKLKVFGRVSRKFTLRA